MAAAIAGCATSVQAQTYTFTKVLDDSGPLFTFLQPAINSAGQVAFWGVADNGADGVYVGSAVEAPAAIATTAGGMFTGFGHSVSINATGQVAFYACSGCGETNATGVYVGQRGVSPTPIATTTGGAFLDFGDPSINATGLMAFQTDTPAGEGVYVAQTGVPTPMPTAIAATGGAFTGFSLNASVNAAGRVAFTAYTDGGSGVYVGGVGQPPTAVASTGAGFTAFGDAPVINGSDRVAFTAQTADGEGVYVTGADGGPVPVAVTTDAILGFGNVALNDAGRVAFIADLPGGERGIYTNLNSVTGLVIGTRGSLDGRTVDNLFFSQFGLAEGGQIAFLAVFTDGTSGIYVAELNPVPEPGMVLGVGMAGLGIAQLARRRSGRANQGR